MLQTEFKDFVFEFAKRVSSISAVRSFIFGPVAKGEADARSDADFLVVLDIQKPAGKVPERRHVSKIALDLEKKFGMASP